jgi:hypothetical protein
VVDFSSSSMHDDPSPGSQVHEPVHRPAPPPPPPMPSGPGPLARVIALVISVGLAWAIAVALSAWLLGLFLTRG